MDNRVTLRPQLPPPRAHEAPGPRPPAAGPAGLLPLQTRVPDLGPFTLGASGFYDLQVHPGPLLKVVAAEPAGAGLDVSA